MTTTLGGLSAGELLAIAALVGGWAGLVLAAVFGLVGALTAGQLAGELDLAAVVRGRDRG